MRVGQRTKWANTSYAHWDIRRFASIPGLVIESVPKLPNDAEDKQWAEKAYGTHSYNWREYYLSGISCLKERFSSFDASLSANNGYRRISLEFTIDLDKAMELKAYAEPDEVPKIFLSGGVLLAAEEAAHVVFSGVNQVFFNDGFDLWSNSSEQTIYGLGEPNGFRFHGEVMKNYGSLFQSFKDNANIQGLVKQLSDVNDQIENLSEVISMYSRPHEFGFLHLCFSRLPMSSARQAIADEFSTLCVWWMISHEDAHRYLGHLHYFFDEMGAADYNELSESEYDEEYAAARRASELGADTAAIHRQIDQAYDSEFIGMQFDMVDPEIRRKIWNGRLERDGLDESQRSFALRYIVGSAVTPLLLFELSRMREQRAESPYYPPLFVRFINLAFESFNRAVAVRTHHPEYLTGGMRTVEEVADFFLSFLKDAYILYHELGAFCCPMTCAVTDAFPLGASAEAFFSESLALQLTLLVGRVHGFSTGDVRLCLERLPMESREASRLLVIQYLKCKQSAFEFEAEEFAEPRRLANAGNIARLEKINEDIHSARGKVGFIELDLLPIFY